MRKSDASSGSKIKKANKHMIRIAIVGVFMFSATVCASATAQQNVNTTIQLPVFRTSGVRTVVSVPDGGTLNLSGGSSSFGGQRRFGRLSGRSLGAGRTTGGTSASAHIIRLREVEGKLLRDQRVARFQTGGVDVNGTDAVKAKADFLTRHIGHQP